MITQKHTASLGSRLVDIIKLREFMLHKEVISMDVNDPTLVWQIGTEHNYWNGEDGESLGPSDLLSIKNWETAETKFPNWKEHILKVKDSDLDYPIWICDMPDMYEPDKRIEMIFDGMHRYTKAVKENVKSIKVIKVKYEDIPEEYFI